MSRRNGCHQEDLKSINCSFIALLCIQLSYLDYIYITFALYFVYVLFITISLNIIQ